MVGNELNNFENRNSPNQNLTFRYITSVIQKRNPDLYEVIASERGLVNEEGKFTNLALLLSDQCVHTIKIAVFEGNNKRILKGQKEMRGCVIKQIVMTCMLIDTLSGIRDVYTVNGAVMRKDFPTVAVKEAVTNAVVHRDYAFSASTLINIFDNRLEVLSVGGIAPELSAEAIQLGISQSRNEGLARIMAELKVMLNCGTGFSKIKAEYIGEKISPEIVTTKGAFKVVLPNINYGLNRGVKVDRAEREERKEDIEARFKAALNAALAERAGNKSDLADEDLVETQEDDHDIDINQNHEVDTHTYDDDPVEADDYTENIQFEKIMKFIEDRGSIKRKQAQLILGVGQSRALAVLSGMQDKGLIKLVGVGRTTEYRKK